MSSEAPDLYKLRATVDGKKKVAKRKDYFKGLEQYKTTAGLPGGTTAGTTAVNNGRVDEEFTEQVNQQLKSIAAVEKSMEIRVEQPTKWEIWKTKNKTKKYETDWAEYIKIKNHLGPEMINCIEKTTNIDKTKEFKWEKVPPYKPEKIPIEEDPAYELQLKPFP